MGKKKIEPTDAIVDDIALYLGREHLVPRKPGVMTYPPRAETMDAWRIVTAVLNHPDARGLFADEDDRPWEPLNADDPLNVGDEVRRENGGTTITAVVGRVDGDGGPWTAEGASIGLLRYGTWYVRRAVQELPTEKGAVIVPADGHEYIESTVHGRTWRAVQAVRDSSGYWVGAWCSEANVIAHVAPHEITPGTWKLDSQ